MTNFKKAFYGLNKTDANELDTIINNVDTLNDNLESYITETELATALTDYEKTSDLTTLLEGYPLDTDLTALSGRTLTQRWNLTPKEGTDTALATTGVDLKTGATYYCKFVADVAMTVVGMVSYVTDAYVYDTTDAKIELKTEAAVPVTVVTYTFPQAGRAAKTSVTTNPVNSTVAVLAAGDAIDIVVTSTGASGAGHVKLYLLYTVN